MDGYGASTYGEAFADVYDDWYAEVSDVQRTVNRLTALASGGPVLELGVGSGRLALPLAARGLDVYGIDASDAMLAALARKPGADRVHAVAGDMADLELGPAPPFALAFAAFNTFFNLVSEEAQRRCFARVVHHLARDGRFVIEAFVPGDGALVDAGRAIEALRVTSREVVLRVSSNDPDRQVVTGRHIHVVDGRVRIRPWALRWATPGQLDGMAVDAGLELEQRSAGWDGEPFDDESDVHVSVYRRRSGNVAPVPSVGGSDSYTVTTSAAR